MPTIIASAHTAADLYNIGALFREYAGSLPIDLGMQGLEAELASLPGPYAPPLGELLLARTSHGVPVGCIALKPLEGEEVGEVKRLFVRPAERKAGVGQALVKAILATAEARGYRALKLDTLDTMTGAIRLYESFGFAPIPDYGTFPYPGLRCFGLKFPSG